MSWTIHYALKKVISHKFKLHTEQVVMMPPKYTYINSVMPWLWRDVHCSIGSHHECTENQRKYCLTVLLNYMILSQTYNHLKHDQLLTQTLISLSYVPVVHAYLLTHQHFWPVGHYCHLCLSNCLSIWLSPSINWLRPSDTYRRR